MMSRHAPRKRGIQYHGAIIGYWIARFRGQ
jgi:hypothetical protein